jgi:hypothetical protein
MYTQLYRSLPVLWKVKSDVYRNRKLKEELVEKLGEIKEDAIRDMTRKKINWYLLLHKGPNKF